MSIQDELKDLGKNWIQFTDYDGARVCLEPDETIVKRVLMLEELTELRRPVHPDWIYEMHFGECCTGAA